MAEEEVYEPATGDLILTNTYTVLSRVATQIFLAPYGHVGICVNLDDTPHLYSITAEHPRPRIIALKSHRSDPYVKEIVIRRLRQPLSNEKEEELKEVLAKYEDVEHPHIGHRLADIRDGHVGTSRDSDTLGDTELVRKILEEVNMIEEHERKPVTTHFFIPGTKGMLDKYYESTLTPYVYKNYSKEQGKNFLSKQMGQLLDMLA